MGRVSACKSDAVICGIGQWVEWRSASHWKRSVHAQGAAPPDDNRSRGRRIRFNRSLSWRGYSSPGGRRADFEARMILLMYFVIIAILGALAALMTVRDVAVIVAFLTLGLGFPIILAATAFVYGVCALPAVAGRRFGSGWEGVALSAGIMATVAIVPGYDAQRRAEEASIPFKRFDFAPPELIGVTSLEIRRRAADYDRTFMDTRRLRLRMPRSAYLWSGRVGSGRHDRWSRGRLVLQARARKKLCRA